MRGNTGMLSLLLLAAMLAGACSGVAPLTREEAKLYQYRGFFNLPRETQYVEYTTFSLGKQFDIYIVSMLMADPQDPTFAYLIAERREKAIPFLLAKLREGKYPDYGGGSATTERVKEKIIFLFRIIHRTNMYNVKGDKEVVSAIREEIGNMEHEQSRQLSDEYLREILEES